MFFVLKWFLLLFGFMQKKDIHETVCLKVPRHITVILQLKKKILEKKTKKRGGGNTRQKHNQFRKIHASVFIYIRKHEEPLYKMVIHKPLPEGAAHELRERARIEPRRSVPQKGIE